MTATKISDMRYGFIVRHGIEPTHLLCTLAQIKQFVKSVLDTSGVISEATRESRLSINGLKILWQEEPFEPCVALI